MMEIIVYYPKKEKGVEELLRRKSALDAKVIVDYIRKLSCPVSQKRQMLDSFIKSYGGSRLVSRRI